MINVIFIHGFCETAKMWQTVISGLSDLKVTFCAVDLPGFGENTNNVTSISEMADYVSDYMDSRNISKAVVIGHSMGGYVALEMAINHAEKIAGIGLLHSHAGIDSAEKGSNRLKSIDFVTKNGPEAFLRPFSKQLISNTSTLEGLHQKAYDLVKHTRADAIIAATMAMINRRDHTQTIKEMSVPILWVIGGRDTFAPIDSVVEQASVSHQAMVEILDNVGHLCMYEDLERTQQIIRNFIHWVEAL